MIKLIIIIAFLSLAAQGQKCLFPDCQCLKSADLTDIICSSPNKQALFPKRDSNSPPPSLISIEFNGYQLDQLPDALFTNLTIYELRLINNSIQSINATTFNGIRSLNALTILEPQLKIIDTNAFRSIRSTLRKLQITSNMSDYTLTGFIPSFKQLIFLSELNLGGNRLTGLNPNISVVLPNLAVLHLVANEIKHIDSKSLANFKRLSELYLDLNQINDLKGLIRALESVRYSLSILSVSQNLIKTLTDFPIFPRLIQLSLDRNQLTRINATNFKWLTLLKVLEIGHNMINVIEPDSLSNLFFLETLGLGGNQLAAIPNILTQVNLKYIFLNNQVGGLFRWVDDYSFDRLIRPFSPLTIYLDGNEGVNFGNRSFCSNYFSNFPLQELILTLSSAVNFNKCLLKQLGSVGAKSLKSFTIVEGINMRRESISRVCNCEFIRFAAYYGIQVQGVCDKFINPCTDYKFQDDCPKDFDCRKDSTSSNSAVQTTTLRIQTSLNHSSILTTKINNCSTISSTKSSTTTIHSTSFLTNNTSTTTAFYNETSRTILSTTTISAYSASLNETDLFKTVNSI